MKTVGRGKGAAAITDDVGGLGHACGLIANQADS